MRDDVFVRFVRLPGKLHGACVTNDDGTYTILLDPNDPADVQMEGYRHEIEHIERGDFENICDKHVQTLEQYAHHVETIPQEPAKVEEPKRVQTARKPRAKKRVFSALDLELLKKDPWLAEFLGIKKIPKRPNAPAVSEHIIAYVRELESKK